MNGIKSLWTTVIMSMPPAVRGLVIAMSVGGIAGFVLLMHSLGYTGPVFYWTMTIGLIVLALLGAMFAGISKWRKRRKAEAAGDIIQESAGGAEGVTEPDEIARLDQLRKDWNAALKRFQENNDDGLYSLPWYLLVGEPGSGKTEAIRHAGIPFPTGLNKPNQGTGGTYNMDWWFANDAIIIDTAGRLLFNETREWAELLKNIGKVRPLCPINGMLLVIPTDSLLKDSSHEIETKAGRIAEQINSIKRELGIRFPVFVVITKSDYITGFREYFSHIDDPTLEHQMLGWSNPHSLDEPFNPDMVDEHLEAVSERLRRRRTAMLLDPPVVDETSDRSTDQVDALYAFPEEIQRIKNRLRLYMEQIFTPGPWSKKPPFIRGIYFTSSMQEGKELDTALAEMLNVDVAELPEGRAWKKDRAYFLRDLFMHKIFPEQGLVSRAANAAQNYRRNKLIVNGVGLAAIILSALFVFTAFRDFRRSIGEVHAWWASVATLTERGTPSLLADGEQAGSVRYAGQDSVSVSGHGTMSVVEFLEKASENARRSVRPGGLLRPIEFLVRGDIENDTRQSNSSLMHAVAIRPLMQQVQVRLSDGWTSNASDAVSQVVRMAALGHGHTPSNSDAPNISSLLRYTVEEASAYEDALPQLQTVMDTVYRDAAARSLTAVDVEAITDAAATGIRAWREHWSYQSQGDGGMMAQLRELRDALEQFDAAERELLALATPCSMTASAWNDRYGQLEQTRHQLDAAAAPFWQDQREANLLRQVQDRFEAFKGALEREYAMLASELPEVTDPEAASLGPLQTMRVQIDRVWEEVSRDLEQTATPVIAAIARFDHQLVPDASGRDAPGFATRGDRYAKINDQMQARMPDVTLLTLADASRNVEDELADLRRRALPQGAPDNVDESSDRSSRAAALMACALQTARDVRFANLYQDVLRDAPANAAGIAQMVREAAPEQEEMPRIVLTAASQGRSFDGRYDPGTADRLIRGWLQIKNADPNGEVLTDRHRQAMQRYLGEYVAYWTKTVPNDARVRWSDSWSSYRRELNNLPRSSINELIHVLIERIHESIVILDQIDLPEDQAEQLARFKQHLQEIPDGGRASEVVVEWTRIGDTAVAAQRRLLSLRPTEFYELFPNMPIREEGPRPLDYWSQVCYEGLRLVAESASGRAREARNAFEGHLRAFPLCSDAPEELSVEQLHGAYDHVNNLLAAPVATGSGQETLGQGAWREAGMRRDLIDQLRGYQVMADLDRVEIESLRDFITTLVDGEVALTLGGDERNIDAALQFRHAELWIDGQMYRRWTRSGRTWPAASATVSPSQQGTMELRFYHDVADVADEVAEVSVGGWPIIRGLLQRNTEESSDARRVPLSVGAHTVWLGIELENGHVLPRRSEWPRMDNWPF